MNKRLFVGNLSSDSTEDSLHAAFSQDGRRVTGVQLITHTDTGRPRGFGFVEMASENDARAAIKALDGAALDGRNISVSEAQERKARDKGGVGYRS